MSIYNRSSARKSLIDTAVLRAVSQVSTMLGYIVLVRGMTEHDFGILSLLYAFIHVVGTVASLGLQPMLMRFQPEYLRAGNHAAAAWLMRVVSSWRFGTNLVVLAIILLGWNYIAPIFKLTAEHRTAFAGVSVMMLLFFQTALQQQALGSHMLHRYAVGSTTALSLVKLALYGVLSFHGLLSLEAAIFTDTVAYAVAYVSMSVFYRRKCLTPEAKAPFKPDPVERKRLVRYALFNNFNDAGVLLMSGTLDSFFIAAFVSTTGVGIYSFYSRLKHMVQNVLPGRLFENVVRPMFFGVAPAEATRKIPTYFSFLLNINLLVQWPALAYAAAYHAEIVQVIFAGKFIEYSWLLPTVMAFGLLNTMSEPTALVAQYEEKSGIILVSKVFAVYNILAMAALVPLMGLYGAALASGTAQIMKNGFIWWHVRDRAVWTNWRAAIPMSLLLWGGGLAACYGLKMLVPLPALAHMFVGAAVFGVVALLHVRAARFARQIGLFWPALSPGSRRACCNMSGCCRARRNRDPLSRNHP